MCPRIYELTSRLVTIYCDSCYLFTRSFASTTHHNAMQQSGLAGVDTNHRLLIPPDNVKSVSNDLYEDVLSEVLLGVCLEAHRASKFGYLFLDEPTPEENSKYAITDQKGLDIFGRVPKKKQYECVCPNCQRNLAASRFAPHLEKCMGMGRNSSRIASKRIANSSVKSGLNESDDEYDNADSDWYYGSVSDTKKKRRREKNGNGSSLNSNGQK